MVPSLKADLDSKVKKYCSKYIMRFEESKSEDINLVLPEVYKSDSSLVKKAVKDHLANTKYIPHIQHVDHPQAPLILNMFTRMQ